MNGGPIKEATPWNKSRIPNAFVNFSSPSRSTRITDIKLTYAPVIQGQDIGKEKGKKKKDKDSIRDTRQEKRIKAKRRRK